jgi:hypothetical protein
MLELLYKDALVTIFEYLPIKNLIKLEPVCKQFKNIVRSNKWNIQVRLYNIDKIKLVLRKYNFVNFDLSYSLIDDNIVKKLSHCHTLNLSWCVSLTDESMKYLDNCKNLKFDYCPNINNSTKLKSTTNRFLTNKHLCDLARHYIRAINYNNIMIINYFHYMFSNNENNNRYYRCKNDFIKILLNCNVIKLAVQCGNIEIFQCVEKFIDYPMNILTGFFPFDRVPDPMIDVINYGNLNFFKYIVSRGYVSPRCWNNCLKFALEKNDNDIIKYILKKYNRYISINSYHFELAAKHGNLYFFKYNETSNTINDNYNIFLKIAIENNHYDIVDYLLKKYNKNKSINIYLIRLAINLGHQDIAKLLSFRPVV